MMSRARLLEDLQKANDAYAMAKRSLADAKFLARNGMANNVTFAAHVEHVAFHRWMRAHAAVSALKGN
jgi:predicted aminopeptidase